MEQATSKVWLPLTGFELGGGLVWNAAQKGKNSVHPQCGLGPPCACWLHSASIKDLIGKIEKEQTAAAKEYEDCRADTKISWDLLDVPQEPFEPFGPKFEEKARLAQHGVQKELIWFQNESCFTFFDSVSELFRLPVIELSTLGPKCPNDPWSSQKFLQTYQLSSAAQLAFLEKSTTLSPEMPTFTILVIGKKRKVKCCFPHLPVVNKFLRFWLSQTDWNWLKLIRIDWNWLKLVENDRKSIEMDWKVDENLEENHWNRLKLVSAISHGRWGEKNT